MLTDFGTVFAVPQILYILRLFNTFNTQLTLLNFHKKDVSRGTVGKLYVSRGTKVVYVTKCFTWNKCIDVKKI